MIEKFVVFVCYKTANIFKIKAKEKTDKFSFFFFKHEILRQIQTEINLEIEKLVPIIFFYFWFQKLSLLFAIYHF